VDQSKGWRTLLLRDGDGLKHLILFHLSKNIAGFGILPVLAKKGVVTREIGEKIGQALRGDACISSVILILLAQFRAGELEFTLRMAAQLEVVL